MIIDAAQGKLSDYNSKCRNRLVRDKHGNGLDLDAMDKMRDRDSGLLSYVDYLHLTTGRKVENWMQLEKICPLKSLNY